MNEYISWQIDGVVWTVWCVIVCVCGVVCTQYNSVWCDRVVCVYLLIIWLTKLINKKIKVRLEIKDLDEDLDGDEKKIKGSLKTNRK